MNALNFIAKTYIHIPLKIEKRDLRVTSPPALGFKSHPRTFISKTYWGPAVEMILALRMLEPRGHARS